MTTLERRVSVVKRIANLSEKLNKIDTLIALRSHSGKDAETVKQLKKDRTSTVSALKRWQKEM